MKFKAIIFDLDGTIADTLPLCIAAFKKSIQPWLQTEITEEEIIATFGPSEEGTIRKLIPAHEEEGVKAYLHYYEEMHDICTESFPGVTELLEYLKNAGIQLAMVTGKGIYSTRLSLKQFGLESYFEIMETGSPEGPNKVNGIRSALTRLNTAAAESIYVGDAPSDILACREVGIPIAVAAWASSADLKALELLNPSLIFHSLQNFGDWIADHI